MKYFLDSANLSEIQTTLECGFVRGVTTNPQLVRAEVRENAIGHLGELVSAVRKHGGSWPISVQVMTREPSEMLSQAEYMTRELQYDGLVIKVPCSPGTLSVVHNLSQRGIPVNCTACITLSQALLAAAAGARYVSMFYGKMTDAGIDGRKVLATATEVVAEYGAEVIVGSIRRPYDIYEIAESGVHIATLPYKYFGKVAWHEKTDEAVDHFAEYFLPLGAGEG